jgi:hypothetical protein
MVTARVAIGQPALPQELWRVTIEDSSPIVASAWSPTDSCVAVATATTVHVVDRRGRPQWHWNFRETTRFLHPKEVPSTPLAVSPRCDAVAVGGPSDYRYVWIANRQGARGSFKTAGTIHAVKFDLRGETAAVSTGASKGYLITRQLKLRWAGPLIALPIMWPGEGVNDDIVRRTAFAREDVDTLFAAPPWGQGISDSVSDDGEWRVVETAPYRGPGTGMIMFWGPHTGGFRPRVDAYRNDRPPRWSIPMGCPSAVIARDGEFVVATGDLEHPEYDGFGDNPACNDGDNPTYVFDRDGKLVVKWPPKGNRQEMANAVFARTGKPLNVADAKSGWDWPQFMEFVHVLASDPHPLPRTRAYSRDGRFLVASRDRELRLYSKPNGM